MSVRSRSLGSALLVALAASVATSHAKDTAETPSGPRRGDVVDVLHGVSVCDPYRWMEDDEAPDVVAYDHASWDATRAVLDAWPEREAWRARIAEELDLPSMKTLPTFEGGWHFFLRRSPGMNHAVLYRVRDDDPAGVEHVVIDPNTWSEDGTAGLRRWVVSPTARHVAYLRDDKGSEASELHVLDLEKGEHLPERITRTKFSNILWDLDGQGFFYSRLPDPESVPPGEAQYHRRTFHHRLGQPIVDDVLVTGRGRPPIESSWFYRTSDDSRVFLGRGLPYRNFETYELSFDGEVGRLVPLVVGATDRTHVDRVGDTFVMLSDRESGARHVFTAPANENGAPGPWQEFTFPRGERSVVDDWAVVDKTHLVVQIRENVVSRLFVRRLDGTDEAREIPLPGPGSVESLATRRNDTRLWFRYQSYSMPPSNWVVDLATAPLVPERLETMQTTIDLDTIVSEQTSYKSKDGTDIPLFLIRRKDVAYDGKAPCVLYGYGGFRVGLYPSFSKSRALFAERGGIYAVACLRGGDEFGEAWHEAGALQHKQNVFDDFIAAADWLVETGKASRRRLAIEGGSNGGLLVAACANQRPDLCRAVLCGVPLTDMLRYHLFQYAKTWAMEYGNPDDPTEFAWIHPYSPYHNVQSGAAYPAMLISSGLHDGRVDTFHARKYAAAVQHATKSDLPVLLRVDRQSGHGSASLAQYREELLDEHAFLALMLEAP